ncbi:trimeric intracellular cation channel family protein [Nocardioides yefusunii]|uniref:Trimeric intracellular cation channel family protein n=1 Tax=Nocardioides yefusunii TaxID=2500546 RepID=A0ABW1QWD2_9ACTN|nr:TRIC cation channel family protein [Nocardioides yefusunii]
MTLDPVLLTLDLIGTFAFALNGALVAIRLANVDIIGVLTLGTVTAVGGGIVRDLMIGDTPPATFSDWRYLAVAALGSMVAFVLGSRLDRLTMPITVLDAAGLSLFAVTGAHKAVEFGLGPVQAIILGAVTGVGGGTIRDMMLRQVPTVLRQELYAIPALAAAALVVLVPSFGWGLFVPVTAALICFTWRMVAVVLDLHAPKPLRAPHHED